MEIRGCIVTIDAIGRQKEIAAQIRDKCGHDVLAVKENQPGLLAEIRDYFEVDVANGYRGLKAKSCEETDTGHGWSEVRRCWQSADFKWVPASQAWAGAKGVARVECERHLGDKVSREVRVYISSLPGEPVRHLGAVRGHGGIENRLHWVSRRDFPGGLQPSPSGACGRESHRAPTNGAHSPGLVVPTSGL